MEKYIEQYAKRGILNSSLFSIALNPDHRQSKSATKDKMYDTATTYSDSTTDTMLMFTSF